jgi:phenylacetate-CoA ligase
MFHNRSLHRHVVYPAILRFRGEGALFSILGDLARSQWDPVEDQLQRQSERLRVLLNHARHNVPYYRDRWPVVTSSSHQDPRSQLADLPLITKNDLQKHSGELLARHRFGRTTRKTTGGSTGEPVTIVKSRRATAHERAAMWLGYGWYGVRIGDRSARFWGVPFSSRGRAAAAAGDWGMNRIRLSAFAFDDVALYRYWDRCRQFKPDYFHGYVSMLEAFAAYLETRGIDGTALGLKAIIATSEPLTRPQRERLERTFGAPVRSEYGCGEVGPIAYECGHGSMHLLVDNVLVEFLKPDGSHAGTGESGEIVVTDLHNYSMPLVRYRLGDIGTPGDSCDCGRGYPVLGALLGRSYDFVQTPDGIRYHGEFFLYIFEDLRRAKAPIRQFQIVQSGPHEIEVIIVPDVGFESSTAETIKRQIGSKLQQMQVTIRKVSFIERTPSGKMQVIRNDWSKAREEN